VSEKASLADKSDVTATVVGKLHAIRFEDFPAELVQSVRTLAIDGIAVAVAGAVLEEAPKILAGHLGEHARQGDVSTFGLGLGLAPIPAAMLNATSMHVLDYEPMWRPATHALSPVLAASLAIAEDRSLSGRDVLTALVRGIEIQGWLREAGKSESRDLRFHPPGVVGPIGAAVAASFLLGLDADQTANALGMVSSRCGSLFTNLGTMTKSTHCGQAAANGLDCALLTKAGFSATHRVFDPHKQGYVEAFMPGFDLETLLRLGDSWRILDPGYAIKIYPAKFSTHYGIAAALELHSQIPNPGAIRAIELVVADVPSADRPFPRSGLDGKFSVQYTAAAALLDGRVGLDTFTDERLHRADMQRVLPLISVSMPAEMPSAYDSGRYAEVTVILEDGRKLQARCSNPRGSWGGEPITAAEHDAKVRNCLSTSLETVQVDEVVDLAARFEDLDAADLRRLFRLASGRKIHD
jgi:aconitate decarboxylase